MTTTREVREDQHGTATGYTYGCRCERCQKARAEYVGVHWIGECAVMIGDGKGATSRCAQIATRLADASANLRRIAHLANKSSRHFAKYAAELHAAKEQRARVLRSRDNHMTECPAAADRFAS